MTWKLIGSHAELPALLKAISERFYYSPVHAEANGAEWFVVNSKGILEGVRIVKKGKRYRFEMSVSA